MAKGTITISGEAEAQALVGATTATGTFTVGVDDTGHDVKFFGATSGKSLLWDESADSLIVTGTTTLVGTTNLDAVDIDGVTQIDAAVTVGVDDTGHDVKFFGATSGSYMLWDESADSVLLTDSTPLKIGDSQDLTLYHDGSNSYITNAVGVLKIATLTSGIAVTIGHTTSETTIADNLTVTGDLTISGTTTTATGLITANGGLETDTNSKIKQKGAFMQSSTHQALTLGA